MMRVIPAARAAAGRFYLGHALTPCAAGEAQVALGAVKALSAVWPEGRVLALDCEAMAAVW